LLQRREGIAVADCGGGGADCGDGVDVDARWEETEHGAQTMNAYSGVLK
jgi:hypothetical protein